MPCQHSHHGRVQALNRLLFTADALWTGFYTCPACLAVNVNISGMQPAPVPLYPGSLDPLFKTVFHFESTFNHTEDGGWPSEEPPKVEQWVVLSTVADAKEPFVYTPDSQQLEGYWNVQVCGVSPSHVTKGPGPVRADLAQAVQTCTSKVML